MHRINFLLAFVFVIFLCASGNTLPSYEWDALQSLYLATNGDQWVWPSAEGHWNFTSYIYNDPCEDGWLGVQCAYISDSYSSVIALDLSSYGLDGVLPGELENLPNLGDLYVDQNELHGQ